MPTNVSYVSQAPGMSENYTNIVSTAAAEVRESFEGVTVV